MAEEEEEAALGVTDLLWRLGVVLALSFLSQTFTGLNIGLMSLDTAQLKVLMEVAERDKTEEAMNSAKYAKAILPLRSKGNLLLCTILLGNTAVNAIMTIFLGELAGGIGGWAISTFLIVIFSEILPQSLCTRHGLYLGAMGAPIIKAAMVLLYPICKPYAIVLDYVFPQRENILDKSALTALVEYQDKTAPEMLAEGQAEMLIGALQFATRTVNEVMVPMDKVFKIDETTELDYELVSLIVQKGYSRFPICNSSNDVVGVLHCKDFLTHQFSSDGGPLQGLRSRATTDVSSPSEVRLSVSDQDGFDDSTPKSGLAAHQRDRMATTATGTLRVPLDKQGMKVAEPTTAGELLQAFKAAGQSRTFFVCGRNTTLKELLNQFKYHAHLAVVADVDEAGKVKDASTKHIGLVTLHNVFETLVMTKGFQEDKEKLKQNMKLAGTVRLFDRRFRNRFALEDGAADDAAECLGEPEANAVSSFLGGTQPAFHPDHINHDILLELLMQLKPIRLVHRGKALYRRGERADFATIVLQGALRISSGEEEIVSTMGPWTTIGMQSLDPPVSLIHAVRQKGGEGEELLEHHDTHDYIPDWSAAVPSSCLVLQIRRKEYLKAYYRSQMRIEQEKVALHSRLVVQKRAQDVTMKKSPTQ